MTKNRVPIYGLEEFGLNLKKLVALGARPVRLHVYFRYTVDEAKLFSLTPAERKQKVEQADRKSFLAVQRQWPTRKFECIGKKNSPYGIKGIVEAKKVLALQEVSQLAGIWIDTIPGYKRRPKQKERARQRWFAVQARFAVQIEEQTTGRQTYEDRIVLVKAVSADQAQKKLKRSFEEYGRPYLNRDGYMVRWIFENILNIYELLEDKIDPKGTEVFSVLGGRRLKPEHRRSTRVLQVK